MAPMSEFVIFPLADGIDIGEVYDENTKAGKIIAGAVRLTAEQPGFQRSTWGLRTNSREVVMIVNWDDPQSHQNYMNAPFYNEFIDVFNTIVGGYMIMFHVVLAEDLGVDQGLGLAPLAELGKFTADVGLIYLTLGPATSQLESDISEEWRTTLTDLYESGKVFNVLSGWSLSDALMDGNRPGKGPEKPFVAMVTWNDCDNRDASSLGSLSGLINGNGDLDQFSVEFQPVLMSSK